MIALVPIAIIVSLGLSYALFLAGLPPTARLAEVLAEEAVATHFHQSRKIAAQPTVNTSESALPAPYVSRQAWTSARLSTPAGLRLVTISDSLALTAQEDLRRLCRALAPRLGSQTIAVLLAERAALGFAGCAPVQQMATLLVGVDLDALAGPLPGPRLVLITRSE